MKIISASIDLSKVKREKIIYGKNGAEYYNFTILVNDTPDQYGKDVQLKESQTKEQREAKEKAPFIGNGKTVYTSEVKQDTTQPTKGESDLPF